MTDVLRWPLHGFASRCTRKTLAAVLGLPLVMSPLAAASAYASGPIPIAVLSANLQNDHAQWVPTTDAERNRLARIEETFKSMLEASGKYKFTAVSADTQKKIDQDQKMGECGGCERRYGEELGVNQVSWIEVQKVSELILNINVYIKDVKSGDNVFMKSVDLRGNNDESWQHSMKFLVKRYLLADGKS